MNISENIVKSSSKYRKSLLEYKNLIERILGKELMSLHPARDDIEARRKREAIELCGKNRGPHDYIAIEWVKTENTERVTRLLCRVCFCNISTSTLISNYEDVSYVGS